MKIMNHPLYILFLSMSKLGRGCKLTSGRGDRRSSSEEVALLWSFFVIHIIFVIMYFLCFRPLVLVLCLHFLRFGFSSCTGKILELFLQNTWVFHRPSTGRRHCWRHACCACPGFFGLLNFDFSENFCWKRVFWNCYLWTTHLLKEPWILWHWFFHLKRIWL